MEEEVGGGGDEENESSKSLSDLAKSITILGFTLNVFFFFIDFFFLLIPKLKKYIFWKLTAAHNWGLIESYIDKNWKLEDWIDKTES